MLITIPKSLETDIMNFTKINNIENINEFLVKCLRDGYNIVKYGTSPKDNFNNENKPLKDYESTEESNIEGLEKTKKKSSGRPKKQSSTSGEENSEPIKKTEEPIKPKKTIRIIKT